MTLLLPIHPPVIDANPDNEVRMGWLPVHCLYVDPDYQRERVEAIIRRIRDGLRIAALETLLVNDRGDEYYVIDGQQTTVAMRELGFHDMLMKVEVHRGLTRQQEAELYEIRNMDRAALRPGDYFKERIFRELEREVWIKEAAETAGWTIGINRTTKFVPGTIRCIPTLEAHAREAIAKNRPEAFEDGLLILYRASGDDKYGSRRLYVDGVLFFCLTHWGKYDRARVIAVLKKRDPERLIEHAYPAPKGRRGREKFSDTIAEGYNAGLTPAKRLPLFRDGEVIGQAAD